MIIQFHDRYKEREELKSILNSNRFEFVVIYGRRRIGKTELVIETTKSKKRIYFLATEENNLNRFYDTCIKIFPEISNFKLDWEIISEYIKNKIDVLIIDEFQNMIKENPKIISLFQAIIDTQFKESKLKLILLGSSVSIIKSKVLSHSSPLYGRRTASFDIKKIEFEFLNEFFKTASFEELVKIYGFCDGIPFYLNMVKVPFEKWINKELNKKSSLIKDEVEFLLKYEFSNPGTYKSILEAISLGKNKLGDIKNHIKVQRTDISQYIKNLIDIGIIKREIPVYSTNNSRSGRYYITDFFVKFWFYYVYQNINQIELGNFKLENYNMYLGNVFEEISKQYVAKVYNYPILGKWWYKENEIDIVTGNKEEAIFCEVKWKNEKTGIKILKKLKQKASLLPIKKKKYMIISKSGFTKELEKEDVELVDIKKIKKVFGVC